MTPEFEQLATFVEHELAHEQCRRFCKICAGERPACRGLPPWSLVMSDPGPFARWFE